MYNVGKTGPCYHCKERHPACWGTCEKYAEMLKDREKCREKANGSRISGQYTCDAMAKTKKRIRKD